MVKEKITSAKDINIRGNDGIKISGKPFRFKETFSENAKEVKKIIFIRIVNRRKH